MLSSRFIHLKRSVCAATLLLTSVAWTIEIGIAQAQSISSITSAGTSGSDDTFSGAANSGGSLGQSLFTGAQTALTAQQGTVSSFVGGQGATTANAGGGQFSKLEQYYVPGSASTNDGTALTTASTANAALLAAPCPSSWPQTMSQGLATAIPSVQAAINVCTKNLAALSNSAHAQGASLGASNLSTYVSAATTLQSADSQLSGLINTLSTDCSSAPACNLVGANNLLATGNALSSGASSLLAACSGLPSSVESGSLTSAIAAVNNASAATNSILTSPQVSLAKDDCEYGAAYTQEHELYSNVNEYASNPTTGIIRSMINNPSQVSFVQDMINATYPTAATFSNYFSGCSTSSYQAGGSSTSYTYQTPGTMGNENTNTTPVQVCGNYSNGTVHWSPNGSDDWGGISFPDPNADVINQNCGNQTPGASATFAYTYVNNTNSTIPVNIYGLCNDTCTAYINGNQVYSYNDNNYNGGSDNNTSEGGAYLSPGVNQITVYDYNISEFWGIIMAFYQQAPGGGNGPLLFDTNTSWTDVTGPLSDNNQPAPSTSSSTVTVQGATATQYNTTCNAVINCIGTACHNVTDVPDQGFAKAATALQALKMMQTDIQCADGTSVAAGNCQPIVFGGTGMDCRSWPGYASNTGFTGNCCDEGLQAPVPPIGQYIMGLYDIYNLATTPAVDAEAMSIMPISETVNGLKSIVSPIDNWTESAYNSMTTWAGSAWQYVASPFESAGSDIASTFGISGGGAATAVASTSESATQSVTFTGILGPLKGSMYHFVSNLVQGITGNTSLTDDIMAPFTPASALKSFPKTAQLIGNFASDVMIAYTVYQLATIITNMLTACSQEEFQLGYKRKEEDCQYVGEYCSHHIFLLGCVEHKHVFCCYQSPLAEIIASQIRLNQSNIAGGYGDPRGPQCGGFTPNQLAAVDWSDIDLSAWTAMLANAGLMPSSDSSASALYNEYNSSHPTGGYSTSGIGTADTIAPGQTGVVTDQNGNEGDSAVDDLERAFSPQGNAGNSTTTQ